jgi:hypothetical protein
LWGAFFDFFGPRLDFFGPRLDFFDPRTVSSLLYSDALYSDSLSTLENNLPKTVPEAEKTG